MSSTSSEMAGREDLGSSGVPSLANVVYRSRAVTPLSDPELQDLMQTAQTRNHHERVTGVMLYDDSHFFQCLEGPPEGVARIMSSIRNDRRHSDVHVINERTSTSRRFGGWSMKLAAQGADPALWRGEILEPPREIVEDLHRQPAAAPTLLVKLAPPPAATGESPLAASLKGVALSRTTAQVLKTVILSKVIPRLMNSRGLAEVEVSSCGPAPALRSLPSFWWRRIKRRRWR